MDRSRWRWWRPKPTQTPRQRSRFRLEPIEPRLLLSAEGLPTAADALLLHDLATETLDAALVVYVDDDFAGLANGAFILDVDPVQAGDQNGSFNVDAFDTIQAAIDAVDVGGTVKVNSHGANAAPTGAYAESVIIAKALTLDGNAISGLAADVVIDPAAGNAITVSGGAADNVTIRDLRVTGADDGINASSVDSLTITNVRADANLDDGIDLATITGLSALTSITANANGDDGLVGTSLNTAGTVTIQNSTFNDNNSDGIQLATVGNVVTDTITANGNARGVFINTALSYTDTDSVFSNNDNHGIQLSDIAGLVSLTRTAANDNDANNGGIGDGINMTDGLDADTDAIGSLLVVGGSFSDTAAPGGQRFGIRVGNGIGPVVHSVATSVAFQSDVATGPLQHASITGNQESGVEIEDGGTTASITGQGNYSSNLGTGLTLNSFGTVSLSDLTITGNTSGGQISNVTNLNFRGTTGNIDDVITANGASLQHTRDPLGANVVNQVLALSGITNLSLAGDGGNDTFNVTPAIATTINIDGDAPTPPANPGDTLNVDTAGTLNPTLTVTSTPNGFQGSYTFDNREPVHFQEIETGVNAAPVANDDAYNTTEGSSLTVATPGVRLNDTDANGDPLTVLLITGPAHHVGTFTLNGDGSFTYVHDGSETTSDSFTYKANDGAADSNVATVSISVTPVNDAPVADNDGPYVVLEGGSLSVAAPGVLDGDTDVDSPTLMAILVSGPAHHAGTFTVNANGSFTYIHDGSETTSDSFTYKANDGAADSNLATVSITVTPVNDAPVITSNGGGATAAISVQENTAAVTTVTAMDPDLPPQTLTFSIAGGADAARFAINATTGQLSFVSAPDYENPTDVDTNNVYEVMVQVSDGSLPDTQALSVTVSNIDGTVVLQSGVLIIEGTDANDMVRVNLLGGPGGGTIQVISSFLTGPPLTFAVSTVTSIVVSLGNGNDNAGISNQTNISAFIDGGAGNDVLDGGGGNDIVRGGSGNDVIHGNSGDDVLVGGDGDDVIHGGDGRDLVIGGSGADNLTGNNDDDILIAGTTDHDSSNAALLLIMNEWTSASSFQIRVQNLTNGTGLNGAVIFNASTVHDDLTFADVLTGNGGNDWFLYNFIGSGTKDTAGGLNSLESAQRLDI